MSHYRPVGNKTRPVHITSINPMHRITAHPKKILIKPANKIISIAGAQTTNIPAAKPIITPSKQDSYALVVGVNYVNVPNARLHGCANDAVNICDYLVNSCNVLPSKIRLLSDEINPSSLAAANKELTVLGEPTRANILAGMEWLVACSKMSSNPVNLFFYYSGHGSYVQDLDGDEQDGYDETILPCDFLTGGEIIDDEMKSRLTTQINSQSTLVGVFDCCHSGTAMDLPVQYLDQSQGPIQRILTSVNTREPFTKAKVIFMSGCRDDQTSAEAPMKANWPAGALTTNLLNILRAMGKRVPSWYEVWQKLKQRLAAAGYDQVPQVSSGYELDIRSTQCIFA